MKDKWITRMALAVSLSVTACGTIGMAHPKLFSDYSLDEAKQKAKDNHKLLLVDFTASWCGPCHMMDNTTWSDSTVESWIDANAVAVQIDVDQERQISQDLHIQAMPTLVVFNSGSATEFDRQLGYKTPPQLLEWLNAVKAGKKSTDITMDRLAQQTGKGGEAEVRARYAAAKQLSQGGKYAEATDQYVWLWNNIMKECPSMVGVRSSFMVADMMLLAAKYPDAQRRFAELRDEAEKKNNREDWIDLNNVLRQNDKTLAWFDKVKTDPSQQKLFESYSFAIEPILARNKRWADAAEYLYKDPIKKINEDYQQELEVKRISGRKDIPLFASGATKIYGSYLGAGRDKEAEAIAKEALKLQDDAGMRNALASMAYAVDCVKPIHLQWIDEAAPEGKSAKFYWQRGDFCNKLKLYDQALKDYDESLRIKPQAEVYWSRGNVLSEQKKYAKAVADFDEAVKLQPKESLYVLSRGITKAHSKNIDGALDDFKIAEALAPKNPAVFIDRSDLFLSQKKYQEAVDDTNKALALHADDRFALCNRGEAFLGLGKVDDAVTDLTSTIKMGGPQTAEAYYFRAQAYDKLGKKELATQDSSKAKQLGYALEQ